VDDHRDARVDPKAAPMPEVAAAQKDARERQSHVRHELRAPLSVMLPLLSVLLDDAAGELSRQQREYLTILERNVVRLEGMIASTADSGWLDCAATPSVPGEVPLAEVVDDLLAVRHMSVDEGPRIEVRPGTAAAVAWADREQVRQILADMLDNAVHFTPPAGTVRVLVNPDPPPGMVALRVDDSGCGMTADDREHAFEFGYRGAAARELGVPGLGLGLWVCRELVRRLGGSIGLESTPGEGTSVTVTLPAAVAGARDQGVS
jgi:signal transduction histidine kinase